MDPENLENLGITNALSPQELDRKLDEEYKCNVEVDQLFLLYFDPGIPKARDICANSRYGEFFPSYTHKSSLGPSVSAFVSTIAFNPHDIKDEYDIVSK